MTQEATVINQALLPNESIPQSPKLSRILTFGRSSVKYTALPEVVSDTFVVSQRRNTMKRSKHHSHSVSRPWCGKERKGSRAGSEDSSLPSSFRPSFLTGGSACSSLVISSCILF